jgi:hypothetical protein
MTVKPMIVAPASLPFSVRETPYRTRIANRAIFV